MGSKINISRSPENYIKEKIIEFVLNDPNNRLFHLDNTRIFEKPIISFANGKNPLFEEYKEIIGKFHLTPEEILVKTYKKSAAKKGTHEYIDKNESHISVICWVLPISEETKKSNQKREKLPSIRWAHTRNCGEKFNDKLRRFVVSFLQELGYRAVAPMLSDFFEWKEDDSGGITSTWSERHALYAAGLGTFGLCDGFITEAGKAMRCGSVITTLKLETTSEKYEKHTSNCLYLDKGTCGICINRCPADAISESGHDKKACLEYQNNIKPNFEVEIPGCGLCQTGVPCESKIPES